MFDDIIGHKNNPKSRICPYCHSKNIEKNGASKKSGYSWYVYMTEQPMKCNICDGTWIFVYDWRYVLVNTKTTV